MKKLTRYILILHTAIFLLLVSHFTVQACLSWFWYRDVDGDGLGDPNNTTTTACGASAPAGYVANNLDSNDSNIDAPVWYSTTDQVFSVNTGVAPQIIFSEDSTAYVMIVSFATSKLSVLKK